MESWKKNNGYKKGKNIWNENNFVMKSRYTIFLVQVFGMKSRYTCFLVQVDILFLSETKVDKLFII